MKNKLLLLIFCLLLYTNVYAHEKDIVLFNKCIDGDTAQFTLNNEKIKVRFLAIDTYETVHPTKESTELGKNASEYTCNIIKNAKKIELEYDPESAKLDKYNRILAWVWVDDLLLQNELIKIGYAEVKYIYGNYLYTDTLYILQEKAQKEKIGIWHNHIPQNFTVTFNEGSYQNVVIIEEFTKLDSYIPQKKGYKFIGWYLNNQEFNFNNYITKDLTLTARFEKVYTIFKILIGILILILLYFLNNKAFKRILKKKLKKII